MECRAEGGEEVGRSVAQRQISRMADVCGEGRR